MTISGRHNITILEREYSTVTVKGKHSIATADVIVDARTGIILRPVSQLEDTLGLKNIVNLTYSLSTQYELLWIILYSTPTDRLVLYWVLILSNLSGIYLNVS